MAALGSAGENLQRADAVRHSASLLQAALRDAEFAQSRYLLSGERPDHERYRADGAG